MELVRAFGVSRQWLRAHTPSIRNPYEDSDKKGRAVEHFGSHYIVALHEPQLRAGLIGNSDSSRQSLEQTRSGSRLRFWLVRTGRALAIRFTRDAAARLGPGPRLLHGRAGRESKA